MTAPESIPPQLATIGIVCDGKCTHPASYIARIHNTDACCNAELNPDGDSVYLYCQKHLEFIACLIGDEFKRRLAALPNGVNFYPCSTCGKPIAGLCDLLDAELI